MLLAGLGRGTPPQTPKPNNFLVLPQNGIQAELAGIPT
jgi:hypothetical protein